MVTRYEHIQMREQSAKLFTTVSSLVVKLQP